VVAVVVQAVVVMVLAELMVVLAQLYWPFLLLSIQVFLRQARQYQLQRQLRA
jgi:hypothetical protein